MTHLLDNGLDVLHEPGFIEDGHGVALLKALTEEAQWCRPALTLYGETRYTRRQVAWHADDGYVYRYSGQEHAWKPWTPAMLEIRKKVEARMNMTFTGVLLNLYVDGDDYISPHADDESDLEDGAPIVSVSLGATRDFVFKMRYGRTADDVILRRSTRYVLPLANGDLVIMQGITQNVALHSLPKRTYVTQPRISLTFRKCVRKR